MTGTVTGVAFCNSACKRFKRAGPSVASVPSAAVVAGPLVAPALSARCKSVICDCKRARCSFTAAGETSSTGDSSCRSASAVLLKNAKKRKYSFWVIGSYLCVWHCAHAIEVAIHTDIVVLTRSMTAALRNSSSVVPPSLFVMVLR